MTEDRPNTARSISNYEHRQYIADHLVQNARVRTPEYTSPVSTPGTANDISPYSSARGEEHIWCSLVK
jgi:hypothetical protein